MNDAVEKHTGKSLEGKRSDELREAGREQLVENGFSYVKGDGLPTRSMCSHRQVHTGKWLDDILNLVTILWQLRIEWTKGVNRNAERQVWRLWP